MNLHAERYIALTLTLDGILIGIHVKVLASGDNSAFLIIVVGVIAAINGHVIKVVTSLRG